MACELHLLEASDEGYASGRPAGLDLDVWVDELNSTLLPAGGGRVVVFPPRLLTGVPWGRRAWRELEKRIEAIGSQADRILLRPRVGHVLADAPACLGWLNQEPPPVCGVALAPASMLVTEMVPHLNEHLDRMFEYLGARAGVVILEDVRIVGADEAPGGGGGLVPCLPGGGLLDGPRLGGLIDRCVPATTPVCVLGSDLDAAERWLWPTA